jgi:hypothetical protein
VLRALLCVARVALRNGTVRVPAPDAQGIVEKSHASDVATRSAHADDQTVFDRIAAEREHKPPPASELPAVILQKSRASVMPFTSRVLDIGFHRITAISLLRPQSELCGDC